MRVQNAIRLTMFRVPPWVSFSASTTPAPLTADRTRHVRRTITIPTTSHGSLTCLVACKDLYVAAAVAIYKTTVSVWQYLGVPQIEHTRSNTLYDDRILEPEMLSPHLGRGRQYAELLQLSRPRLWGPDTSHGLLSATVFLVERCYVYVSRHSHLRKFSIPPIAAE